MRTRAGLSAMPASSASPSPPLSPPPRPRSRSGYFLAAERRKQAQAAHKPSALENSAAWPAGAKKLQKFTFRLELPSLVGRLVSSASLGCVASPNGRGMRALGWLQSPVTCARRSHTAGLSGARDLARDRDNAERPALNKCVQPAPGKPTSLTPRRWLGHCERHWTARVQQLCLAVRAVRE